MNQDQPTGPAHPSEYDRLRAKEDARRQAEHKARVAAVDAMEPLAEGDHNISQAISLKRIADALHVLVHKQLPPGKQ